MFHVFVAARRVLVLALVLGGAAASAETFSVSLGARTLGTLVYGQEGGVETLASTMNNTPLGVFNGTFEGVSNGTQYRSASVSSRKTREISVRFAGGRAIETAISPDDERTELSDPALAPAGVIDPVATMGRFITASGCPAAFRLYDGRRAVLLQPVSGAQTGTNLVCEMTYGVTDGPGHLSPLYIKSISVRLTYDVSGKQSLREMQFGAAGFDLVLTRQN